MTKAKCPRCGGQAHQADAGDYVVIGCLRASCGWCADVLKPSAIPESHRAPQKRYAYSAKKDAADE